MVISILESSLSRDQYFFSDLFHSVLSRYSYNFLRGIRECRYHTHFLSCVLRLHVLLDTRGFLELGYLRCVLSRIHFS